MDAKTLISGVSAGALSLALSLPLAHADQHKAGEMKDAQKSAATKGSKEKGAMGGAAGDQAQQAGLQASQLIGSELKNYEGETLGTIEDIVLNQFGEVSYVALKPAEGVEAQGQRIAVPWHALTRSQEGGQNLVLPMKKEQLAQAPGLGTGQASPVGESDMRAALDRYYLVVAVPGLKEVSFPQLDADGNNLIDRREALQADVLAQHFPAVDQDNTGTISTAEFAAFEQQVEQLRQRGQDAQQQSGGKQMQQGGGPGAQNGARQQQ